MLVEAGYRVGLVMPSTIAALPLCSATQEGITLFAKYDRLDACDAPRRARPGGSRLVRSLDSTSEEDDVVRHYSRR